MECFRSICVIIIFISLYPEQSKTIFDVSYLGRVTRVYTVIYRSDFRSCGYKYGLLSRSQTLRITCWTSSFFLHSSFFFNMSLSVWSSLCCTVKQLLTRTVCLERCFPVLTIIINILCNRNRNITIRTVPSNWMLSADYMNQSLGSVLQTEVNFEYGTWGSN